MWIGCSGYWRGWCRTPPGVGRQHARLVWIAGRHNELRRRLLAKRTGFSLRGAMTTVLQQSALGSPSPESLSSFLATPERAAPHCQLGPNRPTAFRVPTPTAAQQLRNGRNRSKRGLNSSEIRPSPEWPGRSALRRACPQGCGTRSHRSWNAQYTLSRRRFRTSLLPRYSSVSFWALARSSRLTFIGMVRNLCLLGYPGIDRVITVGAAFTAPALPAGSHSPRLDAHIRTRDQL